MILFAVFAALVGYAYHHGRKANGTTQEGVDASVKSAVFVVLAIVALMYLTGAA